MTLDEPPCRFLVTGFMLDTNVPSHGKEKLAAPLMLFEWLLMGYVLNVLKSDFLTSRKLG